MSNSKIQSITHVAKEVFVDAISLVGEVLLGKPLVAQAACFVDLSQTCSNCGSCGVDKRKYKKFCYECDTCAFGCVWCARGCACNWC